MSKTITPYNANTDTFDLLFALANNLANAFLTTVTLAANTIGDTSTGNGYINGFFGANTIFAKDFLRGGTITAPANLNVSSSLIVTGASLISNANVSFTASNVEVWSNSTIQAFKIAGNSTATSITLAGNTFTLTVPIAVLSGSILLANTVSSDTMTFTSNGISAQLLDTFLTTQFRTAKYVISVKDNNANSYHSTEIMLMQDGGATHQTEYAALISNVSLGVFTSNVAAGSVRFYVTPVSTNTTIKLSKTLLAV